MTILITLLKAAHCRSTHHHFALDALPYLTSRRGKLLGNVLLKHYDQYLLGAKDPDTRFRDFHNHVLHVADNDWGGAPAAAEKWYRQLIFQLDRERWSEAAYAAGVLSHYFTDPLMPLHTAQSEVEAIVHRPIEWSINQSYGRIWKRFSRGDTKVVFELASDPGWLSHAIKRAARVAYRHYAPLIRGYDIAVGTRRPRDGFNEAAIDILAGLFGLSIIGWSAVLERAANSTRSKIPVMNLTMTTLVASVKMPSAWVTRRIESAAEQKAVRAIFEEFHATGTVVTHRPPEIIAVSNEREKDRELAAESIAPQDEPSVTTAKASQTSEASIPAADSPGFNAEPEETNEPIASTQTAASVASTASPSVMATPGARLSLASPLVDAPSIGPKTAKRFAMIGVLTVEQFLTQSPTSLATNLKTSWIDANQIGQWQDQARLVCEVPNLRGFQAQLLVGVECRTLQQLGQQSPAVLHDLIVKFTATSAGSRILRSSRVPSIDEVTRWIHAAAAPLRRTA